MDDNIYKTPEDIIRKIVDVCEKYKVDVYLFGSYAIGTYRDNSDIDIAIDCDFKTFLKIEGELEKLYFCKKVDLVFLQDDTFDIKEGVLNGRIKLSK